MSSHHAVLRWTGADWRLKDLGSRNGTYLGGDRVLPGRDYQLPPLARLAFGRRTQEWELADAAPPAVMMVPVNGGAPLVADGDLIALPSADAPLATVYKTAELAWVLESIEEPHCTLAHSQAVFVGGIEYRFCCAQRPDLTSLANEPTEMEVSRLQLHFAVSLDEEHVALTIKCGYTELRAGSRGHNYLLLTLARARMADAAAGQDQTACGWVYQNDLADGLAMDPQQLNIDVFRLRKHLATLGVVDAANIIERRPGTRQLRIGCGSLSITRV